MSLWSQFFGPRMEDLPEAPVWHSAPAPEGGLSCAVCLYIDELIPSDAITVAHGFSVCENHLELMVDHGASNFPSIVVMARDEKSKRDAAETKA